MLKVATSSAGGDEARLDAVMLEPLVSRLVLSGDGHATALLRSAGSKVAHSLVRMPGHGRGGDRGVRRRSAVAQPFDLCGDGPCASPWRQEASRS